MPFPRAVRIAALIASQRHSCICHERRHTRNQCYHIVAEAQDVPDTFANCIPFCTTCHSEVRAYDAKHGFGATLFVVQALAGIRDDWYEVIRRKSEELTVILHRAPRDCPHFLSTCGQASFNYANHDGFCRL